VADWNADLSLALSLADRADAHTMQRFGAADLAVEAKPDLTPVSDADRGAEELIRAELGRQRPADAVVGEEFGADRADSAGRRWIVDPIDGTKNFVRNVPVWATLIGLQQDGKTVVGVVSAPALRRRWWASAGGGAWVTSTQSASAGSQPRRCTVSKVAALDDASLSYSSLTGWEADNRLPALLALLRRAWRTRAYGDFYSYMLVAEGAVDGAFEPEVSLWDLAALTVIVEEAGGRFTDLSGVDHADGGSAVGSNGLIHDALLAGLTPTQPPTAASKKPYPPAAPVGGLPIEIQCRIGSLVCQVQAPTPVPISSR
jgi:histidinol-phosphatase